MGAGVLVLLLGVVLWRAGRIAMQAEDLFGRLLATGVLCWFAFQSFENIGMTLGIMPVTGVPLPFVSTAVVMFANMLAVGLLRTCTCAATPYRVTLDARPPHPEVGSAAMPVEWLFPRLEPLLPR